MTCGTTGQPGGGRPAGSLTLAAVRSEGDSTFMISASKTGGEVTQSAIAMDRVGSATVLHAIVARAPASGFEAAADLRSARVASAGPFLSGTLDFTADSASGTSAFGDVSGDFVARFDSIGHRSSSGTSGFLTRS